GREVGQRLLVSEQTSRPVTSSGEGARSLDILATTLQVRSNLGSAFAGVTSSFGERRRNAAMQLTLALTQKAVIGSILDQGMLEHIARRRSPTDQSQQLRAQQTVDGVIETVGVKPCYGCQNVMREFATNDGAHLSDVFGLSQPVESGQQRRLQ